MSMSTADGAHEFVVVPELAEVAERLGVPLHASFDDTDVWHDEWSRLLETLPGPLLVRDGESGEPVEALRLSLIRVTS